MEHSLDNRMESFFLAETVKYLYLLFDPSNPLLNTLNGAHVRIFKNGKRCALGAGKKIECLKTKFKKQNHDLKNKK